MHRPCCFIPRFRFESDLYVLSRGILGPDCLQSGGRQPEPRELQPQRLGLFFLKTYRPVFAREFQTMGRDRALIEGKK